MPLLASGNGTPRAWHRLWAPSWLGVGEGHPFRTKTPAPDHEANPRRLLVGFDRIGCSQSGNPMRRRRYRGRTHGLSGVGASSPISAPPRQTNGHPAKAATPWDPQVRGGEAGHPPPIAPQAPDLEVEPDDGHEGGGPSPSRSSHRGTPGRWLGGRDHAFPGAVGAPRRRLPRLAKQMATP